MEISYFIEKNKQYKTCSVCREKKRKKYQGAKNICQKSKQEEERDAVTGFMMQLWANKEGPLQSWAKNGTEEPAEVTQEQENDPYHRKNFNRGNI
jgi:hypothetical protein